MLAGVCRRGYLRNLLQINDLTVAFDGLGAGIGDKFDTKNVEIGRNPRKWASNGKDES